MPLWAAIAALLSWFGRIIIMQLSWVWVRILTGLVPWLKGFLSRAFGPALFFSILGVFWWRASVWAVGSYMSLLQSQLQNGVLVNGSSHLEAISGMEADFIGVLGCIDYLADLQCWVSAICFVFSVWMSAIMYVSLLRAFTLIRLSTPSVGR